MILKYINKQKLVAALLFISLSVGVYGQNADNQNSGNNKNTPATRKPKKLATRQSYPATLSPAGFARNFVRDQKDIWTGPFKARVEDLNWILPAIGLTAGMISADAELSSRIKTTGTLAKNSGNLSNAGLGLAVGGAGALWLVGRLHADDHQQETGILAGEAAINSFVVDEVFKVLTRRERPNEGTGQGRFFRGTIANSSFPSAHAMLTWSIASVIAHEYPGPLTKILTYGLATGVSVARVTGRDHFPSDVIAG
ncbi:MAG TPA: phosphatase PAP2 family protein, partial [Candidatus Angelobacter sp.]|nr:phosphatase PAP2 family protein [Candidatus Angelobacter sp.]